MPVGPIAKLEGAAADEGWAGKGAGTGKGQGVAAEFGQTHATGNGAAAIGKFAFVVSMPRAERTSKSLLLALRKLPTFVPVHPVPPTLSVSVAPPVTETLDVL